MHNNLIKTLRHFKIKDLILNFRYLNIRFLIKLLIKKGTKILIKPTMKCNFNCSYCIVNNTLGRRPYYRERSYSDWIKFISNYPKPIKRVLISGGEPFMYPQIIELVNGILDKGILVSIHTNLSSLKGLKIKNPKNVLILASYHHEYMDLRKFKRNWSIYRRKFPGIVWEFPITYQSISGSIYREFQNSESDRIKNVKHVFSPDGREFSKCYDLEINSENNGKKFADKTLNVEFTMPRKVQAGREFGR